MIRLPKLEGFPQDLRNPGTDEIALSYANNWFGCKRVSRVLDNIHRSQISLEALRNDLLEYDIAYAHPIRDDDVYQLALNSVRRQFVPEEKLIPLTLGGAEAHPDIPKDRSPGLPWKLKGYKTKGDCIADPIARKTWHTKWDNIGRGRKETLPDAALFLRAQMAKIGENKIRAVWGFPIDVIIEEARMFYPYIEWIKRTANLPVAYQVEMATGGMAYVNQMIDSFPMGNYVVQDWRKFDKRVPPWLIRDVFSIILDSFDLGHVLDQEGKIWPVRPERTSKRFSKVVSYFINTPVRLSSGERFRKNGGVPSGSMWTNIIDTLVNLVITRYVYFQCTGAFPDAELYLGDDSFVISNGVVNLDDMAALAEKAFGMIINTSKSYVTRTPHNVHFLGYYNRRGMPFKAQDFLIASFILPERNVDDNMMRVTRAVGQMWSTLDGAQAATWHDLVSDMMNDFGYSSEDVLSHIRSKPGFYKYLRILGINIREITIPEMSQCGKHGRFLWQIEAPTTCKRRFQRVEWDYSSLLEPT
uniref:RdRp n=1 Tax=Hubei partiti-like virus 10 TaxID=1923016 RepID=A0A1L3KLF0_9VIRU|nr:RdRp [Hubei partiti-like virus 10]